MEKEREQVQGAAEQVKQVSKMQDQNSNDEHIAQSSSEIDQQEGNMNNGELGGNFKSSDQEKR